MNRFPAIPGPLYASTPSPQFPVDRGPSRFLRAFVLVWLVGGMGFLAVRFGLGRHSSSNPSPQPIQAPITAISTEDLVHHVDSVNDKVAHSAANLRRAQDQLVRTLPSLDRNYMLTERRRLENALAITESIRRELEQSRDEIELIDNSLKKEQQQ